MRILIVEDETRLAETLRQLMEDQRYQADMVGDLSLECSSRLLRVGERSVRLGFKEFEVMRLLMVNSRAVVSKETLIAKIWGLDSEAGDNNVEVYISFLRKKLAYLGSRIAISTVRKVGYYLEHPGE